MNASEGRHFTSLICHFTPTLKGRLYCLHFTDTKVRSSSDHTLENIVLEGGLGLKAQEGTWDCLLSPVPETSPPSKAPRSKAFSPYSQQHLVSPSLAWSLPSLKHRILIFHHFLSHPPGSEFQRLKGPSVCKGEERCSRQRPAGRNTVIIIGYQVGTRLTGVITS